MKLTVQHYARLRSFQRFSYGGEGMGMRLREPIDHELVALGLLSPAPYKSSWLISSTGTSVLKRRTSHMAEARRPHTDLSIRASRWLEREGRLAWVNRAFRVLVKPEQKALASLGFITPSNEPPPYLSRPRQVVSRPDVISIVPAANRSQWQPWILEVKVSRMDFLRDIKTPLKRYTYALLAERVYYVCPAELVLPTEVPIGCGLIFENRPGHFSVVQTPSGCKPRRSAHINELLRYK
jgi:hypothetical protein